MKQSQKLLIELIRYEISGVPVSEELLSALNEQLIEDVYTISLDVDMGYIVASALSKLNLLSSEAKAAFFNEQLATLYRYEQLKYDLESISTLFEEEGICFIPLKGSVIRDYYPKPEMRTSCDVDVLIHKKDLDRAALLFEERLGYVFDDKCGHDISFYSPAQTKIELHHTLFEHDYEEKEQLDRVWEYAHCAEGYQYKYELDKAFFMFYHIVHIAKHIRTGGCGLRPFADLHILQKKFGYDKNAFDLLISGAGLDKFTKGIFDVADMWFGEMKENPLSDLMASYIFSAGAYGGIENHVAISRNRYGKVKMVFKRIFMPYRQLKKAYPVIDKHPILTPVYEVVRWCRIVFKDKAKKQLAIIKQNNNLTNEKKKEVADLFTILGL